MSKDELRAWDVNKRHLEDFENNKIYPLELFNDTEYIRN